MADGFQRLDTPATIAFPRIERPTPHRFSFDDMMLMQAAGVIDPDARFELIDGEIIDMPHEGEAHLNYKIELVRFFNRHAPDEARVAPDATLMFSQRNVPEPDLYVFHASSPTHPIETEKLHLIIEIADSSIDHDTKRKAELYARHDVVEYWVVDVNARVTHVHRSPVSGAYPEPDRVPFDRVLTPLRLPELALQISSLPYVG
jgi:Uma2 family endonuclease